MSLWNPAFRLVLASGSATRRGLLAAAALPFETAAPNVDERAIEADTQGGPEAVARALARGGEVVAEDSDFAELAMRPLGEAALGRYLDLAGESVLGSVGVYQWEGLGAHLFQRVEGDHSTILGLPMLKLLAALRAIGALTL